MYKCHNKMHSPILITIKQSGLGMYCPLHNPTVGLCNGQHIPSILGSESMVSGVIIQK